MDQRKALLSMSQRREKISITKHRSIEASKHRSIEARPYLASFNSIKCEMHTGTANENDEQDEIVD
jgi:hypothetical protein